jgi:hypothetical protein
MPICRASRSMSSAVREETGTRVKITWQLTNALAPATAVLVVRLGDEMLAAAALQCEMVELQVAEVDDFVQLTLAAFDNADAPVALPDLVLLDGMPWAPERSGIVRDGMQVRIPQHASLGAGVAA